MSGFWDGRPVLVTGGSGLVGSWLVRALVDLGARVVVLLRDADPSTELARSGTLARVAVVSGRLEDYDTLERAVAEHEPDTVFHLAAQTIVGIAQRSPLATFEANVRGTYNLLEACRRHPAIVRRVVVASSDKAYGDSDVLPYVESMPPLGRHPYDVSKSCADLITLAYAHSYGVPAVVTRCGNVYGGGDLNWSRIVPGTIRSLFRGERPVVRSDGTMRRDYVYVRDVVDAYLRSAEAVGQAGVVGEAFNFGLDRPLSVLELVDAVADAVGRRDLAPIVENRAVGEIQNQYLDSGKATARLGWRPTYGLEAGLRDTVAWYREYLGAGA